MINKALEKLNLFRQNLYNLFPKRRDAILNLIDSISSYAHKCNSVVELSESPLFERKYSSITDAIAEGLHHSEKEKIKNLIFESCKPAPEKAIQLSVDCTNNNRQFSKTLTDRSIVHAPNPAPGNRPICVGHQYSMVGLHPSCENEKKKHWVLPLSMERVDSSQKGNEFGMRQVLNLIETLGLKGKLVLNTGDSLYASDECRKIAVENDDVVHSFRMRNNRNVFAQPNYDEQPKHRLGRKKLYGDKMTLSEPDTYFKSSIQKELSYTTPKGQIYQVKLEQWNDVLIKGSKKFNSYEHPINLVKVVMFDEQGNEVFKRPLWIGVLGKRKNELSMETVYTAYRERYDLEHFFRFGKQKLLLDSYQTFDTNHEEEWWRVVMLSYLQLYLANQSASLLPKPWEKYLPEYKKERALDCATPTQVQRNFEDILLSVGSPAINTIPRGNPIGRQQGECQVKREKKPIHFKTKNKANDKNKNNKIELDKTDAKSKPPKIEDLLNEVKNGLTSLNISASDFTNKLLELIKAG